MRGTLPCAYCGCKYITIETCHRFGEQFWYAMCVVCKRRSHAMDCTEDAIDHWNMLQERGLPPQVT